MLIDKIVNIIFKYKVSNLSSEEIIELINFIFDENIYTKSIEYFNEWMKVEKNFNLLKENIGDDKLEKIYLKSDKFIVKDNNKTKKNLLEYDLSNETEFEYLFYICNNIANKGIDYWCSLVEELLKRNNYEIWEYNMLSQFIDPRLNALDAIDWNNLTNKATILYAAKKYFSSYKSNEKEKTLHVCKAEHEILISILLEEEPEFFKNIEESKLENWIMNIFKFEPINEYLLKVVYNKIPDEFIRVATINIDNDYMGCGLIEGNLSVFKYVWNEHISEILYSYLISNEINVYKKKGIFNFLYNMKDRKAIRYADKILNNVNCDDLKLKLFFLGTFFTKGRDDVFRMIQNWAETCIGFTAKFIKVLGDEEYNFNFLNQYSPEEISNLYINFNNEKDVYISDFISRFDGSSFENSISAEIDFDSKKESLLYYLVDNGSDKGGEALYNLKQLFPNDKMVLEKWHKESDKYLSNSWEYIDIRYLKDTVANDKLNIANSEKKYSYKNLLESVIYTCIKLQGTKIYTNRKVSENDRNSFIANLLEAQGYKIKDQTLWGDSSNGKQAGEVDILITEESGIPFSIIEALNLTGTNRSYLNKHLEKIFKYDANGLKFNFIVVYYLGTSFQDFWKNYLEDVSKPWSKFKNLGSPSIIESKYTNLRIGLTKHIRNNESTNLYHICVDMNVN
ncbi:hypothetical protein CLCHR_41950 [Clostridium chromiireducens]|uniref:Uncharacterized protein n=1 Tax=Clostridium chromiireducens TaxID=225345 RepID=A0A1V4ID77_9CLOT|nr:hypothetical protein CLCHR_41950 [Clostridium chromiireducens]